MRSGIADLKMPLRRQLEVFVPADDAEALHRRRMLELIDSAIHGSDPFSRGHFTPGHFTASAFVLSPDLRRLLLIFHSKFHRWLQPGGHIDPGDAHVASAARREVLEEAGLEVQLRVLDPFDLDIHAIPANAAKNEPAHEHFDVRFLFVASADAHVAGSDAKEARWVPLDQVTQELTDASVTRAVRKLRTVAVCRGSDADQPPR